MSSWFYGAEEKTGTKKKGGKVSKAQPRGEDILKSIEESRRRAEIGADEFGLMGSPPDSVKSVTKAEDYKSDVHENAIEFTREIIESVRRHKATAHFEPFKNEIKRRAQLGHCNWDFDADAATYQQFEKFAKYYLDPNYVKYSYDGLRIRVNW